MKKSVKKNLMRGVALLMAVVLVATSGVFHSGGWLRATGIIGESQESVPVSSDNGDEGQTTPVHGNTGTAQLNLPADTGTVSDGDAQNSADGDAQNSADGNAQNSGTQDIAENHPQNSETSGSAEDGTSQNSEQ